MNESSTSLFRRAGKGVPFDRWWITRVTQPLAIIAFSTGALLASRSFPHAYDWRHAVISALQSPRDNPEGYHWLAYGLAVSGLFLLPLAGYLGRVLSPFAPRGSRVVRLLMVVGVAGMMLVALFTHRPAAYPRLHENLALLSYASFVFALLATTVLYMRHPDATLLAGRGYRHWVLPLLGIVIFGPLFAAALSQFFLFVLASVQWAPSPAATLPTYLHLAFWQWILSTLLYGSAWFLAWIAAPPGRTHA